MRLLFEGGDYLRAATIRGEQLFEGSDYSRAVSIRRNAVGMILVTVTL